MPIPLDPINCFALINGQLLIVMCRLLALNLEGDRLPDWRLATLEHCIHLMRCVKGTMIADMSLIKFGFSCETYDML